MSALVCQEVVELASDHLDAQLPPDTATAVDEHLAGCAECRAHMAQVRQTVSLLARVPAQKHPGAATALRAAFRSRA